MLQKAQPLVSVLIPAYKASLLIEGAIASVLEQGHPAVEILVAPDDGQDYSRLAHRYREVKVIPSAAVRSGPGAARNRALYEAKGDFITVLDHDDLWQPGYLGALLEQAERRGLAFGRSNPVDQDLQPIRVPPMEASLDIERFAIAACSVRPMAHRSLEVAYYDFLSEDTLHAATLLARHGPSPVVPFGYCQVVSPTSTAASTKEGVFQDTYLRLAKLARDNPRAIGLDAVGRAGRERVARLFEYRLEVSRRFQDAGVQSFERWIAGKELSLANDIWEKHGHPRVHEVAAAS
ncbi:hypothetical protein GCM10027034_30220 [Ramlibacter solisilvae]|uniref:glycosyltransferase family 2 protein n=1 Tax=Ramlibacter tataouinensis TaxID=94132 RepID=UPI0007771F8E|nr:glycosyltransferase family 2 protein [Ramlibacter tataouinensis]